jgi:hypothetical protein
MCFIFRKDFQKFVHLPLVHLQSSPIPHPPSVIRHPSSTASHSPSLVHPSSTTGHLSSIHIHHLSPTFSHPSPTVGHPSSTSVIQRPPSVIFHPPSVIQGYHWGPGGFMRALRSHHEIIARLSAVVSNRTKWRWWYRIGSAFKKSSGRESRSL